MKTQTFILVHARARQLALEAVRLAPDGMVVQVKQKTRSIEQNDKMWAMATDISKQVEWHGQFLSPTDWKHIFTASLAGYRVVPGIEPGTVVGLGLPTSTMKIGEMSNLIELMSAFGTGKGVVFT